MAERPRLPEPRRRDGLSRAAARRLALAAQGLAGGRPAGEVGAARLLRTIRHLGLLQLDSVSVLVRAHYLPLFARLGAYDRGLLDRLAAHDGQKLPTARRTLFEYWAHEASLLPLELQPLLRWRMARAQRGLGIWKGLAGFARDHPLAVEAVLAEVRDRGPLGVSELAAPGRRSGSWWGWNEGKVALEWLFWTGRLTAAGRRGFERRYDLPERVLPKAVLDAPTPDDADAHRELLRRSARALGVATATDLGDYFRLPGGVATRHLPELVEAGDLLPVAVEGWRRPAFMAAGAVIPRHSQARALLAPFDPVVWERTRTERLFDFHYRIEIYTPAERRQHGYYVLPFLLGDRLVARVDLKADRRQGRLLVQSATPEPNVPTAAIVEPLAAELLLMAGWLGLDRVAVPATGVLAASLRDQT